MKTLLAWLHCRDGATAIEYGLIVAGIAIAIIAAVFLMGDNLEMMFNALGSAMDATAKKV